MVDAGYCQGMSDLASISLMVMQDEEDAFWTFAAIMHDAVCRCPSPALAAVVC